MSGVKLETYIFVTWQKFDDFIRYSSRWSKPVLTNKGLQTCDGHTQNFQFTETNHTIYIDLSKRNLKKIQQQQKSQISHHSSIALLSHIFTFCYRLIFSNACEKRKFYEKPSKPIQQVTILLFVCLSGWWSFSHFLLQQLLIEKVAVGDWHLVNLSQWVGEIFYHNLHRGWS